MLEENQQCSARIQALEFYGLLRTGMDVKVEYSSSEDLKRLRESYIVHLMDYLLQERERVFLNDKKLHEESQEGKLTLDNVFEIAGVNQSDNEEIEEVKQVEMINLEGSDFIKVANTENI